MAKQQDLGSKMISLVIPVYNEEDAISEMVMRIESNNHIWGGARYEILIIDDGSMDDSWKKIEGLSLRFSNVRGVSFSRNFGKESAILAGLAYAKGDAAITMDADLQHPIDKIPEFIEKWGKGAKIVEGIKTNRGKEKKPYSCFASLFYGFMSNAVGKNLSDTSDYKLLDREVIDVILKMPEKQMFYRAITSWVGFSTDTVQYEVQERIFGKTKWSTLKLISYAVRNITSFTTFPLQIITVCSALFFVLSVIESVLAIFKWLNGTAIEGFTTVILLQLISGCLIMFALGLIGYYLSKLIEQARDRPRYIVESDTHLKKGSEETR